MAVDAEKGEQHKLLQKDAAEIRSWPLVQPLGTGRIWKIAKLAFRT